MIRKRRKFWKKHLLPKKSSSEHVECSLCNPVNKLSPAGRKFFSQYSQFETKHFSKTWFSSNKFLRTRRLQLWQLCQEHFTKSHEVLAQCPKITICSPQFVVPLDTQVAVLIIQSIKLHQKAEKPCSTPTAQTKKVAKTKK